MTRALVALEWRVIARIARSLEALFVSLVNKLGPKVQLAHRHLDTLSDNDHDA